MNRVIKFRAWDKTRKVFIDVPRLKDLLFGYGFNYDYTNGDDVELMQFTGLKDKNGVEIYEGDILNVVDTLPGKGNSHLTMFKPVVFNQGCFEVNPCENTGLFLCEIATDETHEGSHCCFVVGNIHENPELLKGN